WAFGVLAMVAIGGALAGYAIYLAMVRSRIPVIASASTNNIGQAETLRCPNCAGMVELQPGDLVGICGYCGGETSPVRLARQDRAEAAEQKDDASVSLYNAMRETCELRENAALAIPMAILAFWLLLVLVVRVGWIFV